MGLLSFILGSAQSGGDIVNPLAFDGQAKTNFPLALPNQFNDGAYISFGTLIFNPNDSNEIFYYVRSGTAHESGGRVAFMKFNISTNIRTNPVIIYEEIGNNIQDVEVTVIGTDIYVWFTRVVAGSFASISYIKSTDFGQTYSAKADVHTTIPAEQKAYNPYGKGFEGASGEYYQPWYDVDNDNTDGRILLFKTVDNGANWSTIVVQGPEATFPYNETAFIKLEANKYLAIARKTGGGLHQIESTDLIAFTAPIGASGINASGTSMADLTLQINRIICWFQQRGGTRGVYFSKNDDYNSVFGNPSNWGTKQLIFENDDARNGLGYPSVLNLGNDEYFIIWHKEDVPDSSTTSYFQRVKVL